jgi:hypothetical protein
MLPASVAAVALDALEAEAEFGELDVLAAAGLAPACA